MSDTTNGVSLLVADNHITINADITFEVEERENVPSAHISDIIYQLVLEGLRKHDKARLVPGQYKAVFTMCASSVGSLEPVEEPMTEEEVESLASTMVDEMLDDDIQESDDK